MNNLTQEQVSDVKSLDELLFDYGNTAYQEGVEGRNHDTVDGKAEKAFQAVKNRFQDLENRLAKNHEDYKIQVNAIADKNDKIAELEKQLSVLTASEATLKAQLAEIMPDKIWCAANKVSSMYFYTEEDAETYASSFGAAFFMEVFAVDVLRLHEEAK